MLYLYDSTMRCLVEAVYLQETVLGLRTVLPVMLVRSYKNFVSTGDWSWSEISLSVSDT